MENQVAERRINTVAAHFAPNYDSSAATHLVPMNCSSSLNSVIRRYDNKMHFARQGSSSQASFMRPASSIQNCSSSLNSVVQRYDNKMHFARQGSSSQASFMRPASGIQGGSTLLGSPLRRPANSINEASCKYNAPQAPRFARPSMMEPYNSNAGVLQPVADDSKISEPDHPAFSRPNRRISEQKRFHLKKKTLASAVNGNGWSPRMDVVEIGSNYIMTIEIPGVHTSDIRIEVHDRNLIVMGKRSTQCYSKDSISSYHKKEILQGPYQVVWPLPADVNKDRVSAEFLDGFLQIIIPKL